MKYPFFRTLVAAGALALICSCSEDTISRVPQPPMGNYIVAEASYVYTDKNNNVYLISSQGIVSDTTGVQIGIANIETGLIINNNTEVIASGVDFSKLEVVSPTVVVDNGWLLSMGQNLIICQSNYWVTDAQGNVVAIFTPTTGTVGNISTFDGILLVEGVDLSTLKVVAANTTTTPVATSSSITTDPIGNSSAVQPGISSTAQPGISSAAQPGISSAAQPASSNSVASSSSVAKSSSSNNYQGSTSYIIKYVNGGKSGSGYATRYWDCCEPHCAWPEHGGSASTCDASGNKVQGGSTSMCNGGNAGICRGQFPIPINDTLAFAFAATPGGENNCGKCFDLVFDGGCKYTQTSLHKAMKGKHLIVMSNNVGYDVAGGQFDVMIPGGGYGIFDGCSQRMGWGDQGSQYGGLLDACEKQTNYKAANYKKCLTDKCNASFANDEKAREGCLFLANWMNAAGNLTLNYKEVECPQELKDRY